MILGVSYFAHANNFFGIPILGKSEDQFRQTIYYLMKDDRDKADAYYEQLIQSNPAIFKRIRITDFTIPCAEMILENNNHCPLCHGEKEYFDKHALNYLQFKFDYFLELAFQESSISEKDAFESAFKKSYEIFNKRKENVLNRQIFQGYVEQIHSDYFIIKDIDDTYFRLLGVVISSADKNDPLMGYCWPLQTDTHLFVDKEGKRSKVSSYTLNLWRDY